LCNRDFLAKYCEGYIRFQAYLLGREDGQPKDARWASRIAEVPAEVIEGLARTMAASRTLVTTSWSIQRADHGEQPVWMTIALATMLGQIGLPGGGFSLGFGAINGTTRNRCRTCTRRNRCGHRPNRAANLGRSTHTLGAFEAWRNLRKPGWGSLNEGARGDASDRPVFGRVEPSRPVTEGPQSA
jgi:anaerobic selenocysteine-containing dehydrogenase